MPQITTTTNSVGHKVSYDYGERYSDSSRKDARRKGDKKKGWQVAEMWDKHHEIARRILLGETNVAIAESLGCTSQQISNVRNSPVVKDKLTVMSAARDAGTIELAREIQDLAPIAILRVREALEQGTVLGKEVSASGILKEANTLIDREIGKPTQTINTRNLHGHFTMDDIEAIKAKAQQLAALSGQKAPSE